MNCHSERYRFILGNMSPRDLSVQDSDMLRSDTLINEQWPGGSTSNSSH